MALLQIQEKIRILANKAEVRVWHIKRVIAYIGLAAEMAVLSAGIGAADLRGAPVRRVTLASTGEPAKCATE